MSILLGQNSKCRSGDCDSFLRDCKLETTSIVMSFNFKLTYSYSGIIIYNYAPFVSAAL